MRRIFYLVLFLLVLLASSAINVEDKVPQYFVSQMNDKIGEIKRNSKDGTSFIFITDTHVKENQMHSPQLIKYILDNTNIKNVIWGGDAINYNRGNIERQWEIQLRFDSAFNNVCNYYKVRGNHDFSITKSRQFPNGISYSNTKAAELLLKNSPSNIHRNTNDPGACYYYYDDIINKIRFIIFDTTDSVPSKGRGYGNVPYIHDSQLQWIADSAISTVSKGYGLVFVSHIPIIHSGPKGSQKLENVRRVRQLIDGVSSHSSGKIGQVKYDFTHLEDIKVLMCISGHIHRDTETYVNEVLYLTTANDGKWKKKESEKASENTTRKVGTVDEQCFDCICISKNKKVVHAYRIGYGHDRHFHLESINISDSKVLKLETAFIEPVSWNSFNATGNKKRDLSRDIVKIEKDGFVRGLNKGTAVVVASDDKGNKEFFNIIVH